MPNYSVECAQPYDNQDDHSAFAKTLRAFLDHVQETGQTASTVVLVDDRSYPDHSFNFDTYSSWLHANGFEPDVVARESQITEACDQVLDVIDFKKLKPELAAELQSENKYISQLFIASWCLIRLGYIQNPAFNPALQGERLVNILPITFKPGEEDSLEIIRATTFRGAADRIDYTFIP